MNKKQIQNVIDGFNKYYKIFTESKSFSAIDFKEYMEPIFTEAGYRQHDKDHQTNILIIHDAGVGDFILMSAAIREIRRLYPMAHITMVIYPRALNLAEFCPYVDELIPNARQCNWFDFVDNYKWNTNFVEILLQRNFDIAYAFTHYDTTPMLAYMSGAKERISYKFTEKDTVFGAAPCYLFSSLMTLEVPQQLYGIHTVDNALGFLDYSLHASVMNREIEVWYTPLDVTVAKELLEEYRNKKLYAVCMGGSSNFKCWSPENYAILIELILNAETDSFFIILGGGDNDIKLSEIVYQKLAGKGLDERILDLTNKTTYRQSAAVLKLCDYYIGTDTSAMHIAAALKVPVLVPFCFPADIQTTNESTIKMFYPYHVPSVIVQPKHALPECKDSKDSYGCKIRNRPHCITQIKPETMFTAFKLLKEQIAKGSTEPLYVS